MKLDIRICLVSVLVAHAALAGPGKKRTVLGGTVSIVLPAGWKEGAGLPGKSASTPTTFTFSTKGVAGELAITPMTPDEAIDMTIASEAQTHHEKLTKKTSTLAGDFKAVAVQGDHAVVTATPSCMGTLVFVAMVDDDLTLDSLPYETSLAIFEIQDSVAFVRSRAVTYAQDKEVPAATHKVLDPIAHLVCDNNKHGFVTRLADTITLDTGDGSRTVPRSELAKAVDAAPSLADYLDLSVGAWMVVPVGDALMLQKSRVDGFTSGYLKLEKQKGAWRITAISTVREKAEAP